MLGAREIALHETLGAAISQLIRQHETWKVIRAANGIASAKVTAMQLSEYYQRNSCTTSNSAFVSLHSSRCLKKGPRVASSKTVLTLPWKSHRTPANLGPHDLAMWSLTNTIVQLWPLIP